VVVNIKKTSIAQPSAKFLGFIVSAAGVTPDPSKVTKITEMALPLTTKALGTFLGMAGYLRRFIRDFAAIAKPLQQFMGKTKPSTIPWTEKAKSAFVAIQRAVATTTTLSVPQRDLPFILETDASDTQVGAALLQRQMCNGRWALKPLGFASAKLNQAQLNYTTTEKEGLAVVWGTETFRRIVDGAPTLVITDHSALVTLLSRVKPVQRLLRWAIKLSEHDLYIMHRAGARHQLADALSRLDIKGNETLLHSYDADPPDIFTQALQAPPCDDFRVNAVTERPTAFVYPTEAQFTPSIITKDQWLVEQTKCQFIQSIVKFHED
jgi:hypothetical protein